MKFLLLFLLLPQFLIAQTVVVDFEINTNACINENLTITNNTTGGNEQEWDFCESDLLVNPILTENASLVQTVTPLDLQLKNDNGDWYGFVCDGDGNKLLKLSYGNSLSNQPIQTMIGEFNIPSGVELISLNGNWYGLVGTFSVPSKLFILDFGNALSNIPIITEVAIGVSDIMSSRSISLVKQDDNLIAFVINFSQPRITRINFGPTPTASPLSIDFIPIDGSSQLIGVDAVELDNGHKFLMVSSYGTNQISKLQFGSNWISSPVSTFIDTGSVPLTNPTMLDIEFEGGNFFLFATLNSGKIFRMNFGSNFSGITPAIEDLGSFSGVTNVRGMDLVRDGGSYTAILSSFSNTTLFRLAFKDLNCSSSRSTDYSTLPNRIFYSSAGLKPITLRVNYGELNNRHLTKMVAISNEIAPDIAFNTDQKCLTALNFFFATSSSTISDYLWDFGDSQTSTLPNPTHQYSTAEEFNISLRVTANNGCSNYTRDTIKIYTPPSASFTLPTGLICTNNEFSFTNNTVDIFDGNLSFQWLLDDVPVSTDEDLIYTFNSGGDKEITLQASIPGCSSESVQIITGVGEGPTVDFTLSGNCQNESTLLTNNSQGAITSYLWDFGNGQTSTDTNPTVNYAAAGNYTVELETLGSNGCISRKSTPHQIFSVPQPNFNIDLPPFSCNGTPTQFNDLTPTLIDSNLDTWLWNFADQNASASIQHPQYTYALSGDYNVSLTVTSDQGCVATTNKTITISQSPQPVIVNTPACVETAVVLQDGSATSASAWQWQVGNNFYFTESPSHVFATAGDYEISLTLTASNGCVRTTTKQVVVPLPLTVNFETSFNCANTATQFTAVVNDVADPVTNYSWFFEDVTRSGATVNYLYNAPGTEEIQLIASTQNGCAYTITKAITILPAPVADFSFTPGSGAPPLAVTFTNQSMNANSFLWKFNDAANTTSSLQSPAFTFTDFGEYAVDLTAKNSAGCESTVSKLIAVALPRINVTLDNFRIIRNTDGSFLLLTNILNNGNVLVQNPKIEIQLDNAATLQEVLNTNIVAGASIDYTLSTLVGANNNLNYACIRLVLPNNEAQENTEACITFEANTAITSPYPNPANEQVTVEWISPTEESVSVMVNDYLGNVMATETISSQQGLNTLKLQTLDWQAGIYFIRIKSNSRQHFFRTIIAR
ncbi:MAG: PKD domain-containing protein [Cytophagia bacterium]|nr:PKD domain-containing protein [Cytophagia bacterium]